MKVDGPLYLLATTGFTYVLINLKYDCLQTKTSKQCTCTCCCLDFRDLVFSQGGRGTVSFKRPTAWCKVNVGVPSLWWRSTLSLQTAWTHQNSMVSSWDAGHSGFGKPIPWHFPFIKFLELRWRRENKSGCSLVSVFFHICFFFFMLLWLAEWGFSHMFPPATPTILHSLLLFFLLTLNRHKEGICWVCLPRRVVRNERLLRHGKVFIILHITETHLLMEISTPPSEKKKKKRL